MELFGGGGGLALGASLAGFDHSLIVEIDPYACRTLREYFDPTGAARVLNQDVRTISFGHLRDQIDLLSGGPPCQPFSHAGKHFGGRDARNLFPQFLRAVREIQPKSVFIENVRGMTLFSSAYLEQILARLASPELECRQYRSHSDRLAALRHCTQHIDASTVSGLSYTVHWKLVNCADYGVPQSRHRLVIVAFRNDQNIRWQLPQPTHSIDRLFYDKWVTGTYWDKHRLRKPVSPKIGYNQHKVLARVLSGPAPQAKSWITVRDAVRDLPEPQRKADAFEHAYIFGARAYHGHMGSLYDEPAKTIKAGAHGIPGGENMLRYCNGRVRYFTIRECARLQGYPDGYRFFGHRKHIMRQIGNAVPVPMSKVVCASIRSALLSQPAMENSNAG